MLKIDHRPTFTRTVTVRLPEGSGVSEQSFQGSFKVLSRDDLASFDVTTSEGTADFVRAVVEELCDIEDAHGKALVYSPGMLEAVIQIPGAARAIYETYADALLEALRKN